MRFFRIITNFLVIYLISILVYSPLLNAQQGFRQTIGNRRIKSVELGKGGVRSFGSSTIPEKFEDSIPLASDIRTFRPASAPSILYSIHVLGEVQKPGTYKIAPSDRVTDALDYAGGVLPNGSERAVQLRRQGKRRFLDLFSYKYKGRLSQNPYLMENDVVFVSIKKGEVQIEGPVKRPGYYEISKSISLKKLIRMAGGLATGFSRKQSIRVVRYNKNEEKEVFEVNANETAQFVVKIGDVVVIPHMLLANKKFDYNVQRIPGDNIFYPTINDSVYVIGSVHMPGPYTFQPNFNYQDYVGLAGPTNNASIKRTKILKANGKKVRAKKKMEINPGDTIIIPSKALTATKFITWFGTLTSMALTTFVFVDRFAN